MIKSAHEFEVCSRDPAHSPLVLAWPVIISESYAQGRVNVNVGYGVTLGMKEMRKQIGRRSSEHTAGG